MTRAIRAVLTVGLLGAAGAAAQPPPDAPGPDSTTIWQRIRPAVERHLGRPYVWGATGMKSFDCSGFVWRVMLESGVLVKRTTARKFYMMLPKLPAGSECAPGSIVFFNRLKHCGIVRDDSTFYHAAVTKGTSLSGFRPRWQRAVCGFRAIPLPPDSARVAKAPGS